MTLLDGNLPSLVIPYPICGHCRNDVMIEDGVAFCEGCRIQWDDISEDAEASPDESEEGSEVQCLMNPEPTRREYDHKGKHVTIDDHPCILPSGHESVCLRPYDYESAPMQEPTS